MINMECAAKFSLGSLLALDSIATLQQDESA